MGILRVKQKLPLYAVLAGLAMATFLMSWAAVFPPEKVESSYSRWIYPAFSTGFSFVTDAVPFSWLDVCIPVVLAVLVYSLIRRRWRLLIAVSSVLYLWFFWSWGLNYHRLSVADRMHLSSANLNEADRQRFSDLAVRELNRLWPLASKSPLEWAQVSSMASGRVERVVAVIDGTTWRAPKRVKWSLFAGPWYQVAGIDGMFNPFGQEPLVVKTALPFELPFLMSHELAHVGGVANEGDANLVGVLATIASDDPRFQYSGWLEIWRYLRIPQSRLDPGPQADLRAIRERVLAHQIRSVSNIQSAVLDAHLKANAVPDGIRSYSDFLAVAIASQPRWAEFR